MTPVASRCHWKGLADGVIGVLLGLAALAAAFVAVPMFIIEEKASWGLMVMGVMPLGIGWGMFSGGVRTLRQNFSGDWLVAAGREGIALRVPGPSRAGSLWLTYSVHDVVLPWADIRSFYPHVFKVNGIPMSRQLYIETADGRYEVPGFLFTEPPADMAARIEAVSR